ncbi:MAG: hypothetical protein A2503_10125 [Burkholderiales bacterium RIFOXYD12_FULL_59_19]|nr:MAG: hypothetical protein A2503_10125 [Burkholderiales bacterium RIFOXYD12_FULL_59_19]
MNKHRTCDTLGVCQGLSARQCPDCTSFECDVPCSPEPPRPTYPFAPGVIQGSKDAQWNGLGESDAYPLATRQSIAAMLLVLLLAVLGSVVGGFLAGYLHLPDLPSLPDLSALPAWLLQVLPG